MIGNVAVRLGPSSKVSATVASCGRSVRDAAAEPVRRSGVSAPTYSGEPDDRDEQHGGRAAPSARPGRTPGRRRGPTSRPTPAPKNTARITALRAVGALREQPGRDQRGEHADDTERAGPTARRATARRRPARPRRVRGRRSHGSRGAVATATRKPSRARRRPARRATALAPAQRSPRGACGRAYGRPSRRAARAERFRASWDDGRQLIAFGSACSRR